MGLFLVPPLRGGGPVPANGFYRRKLGYGEKVATSVGNYPYLAVKSENEDRVSKKSSFR